MAAEATTQRKTFNANPRHQPHVIKPESRNTISVGCKLPHGMHLDIRKDGQPIHRFTLKGINSLTAGAIMRVAVREGFAINENVPKEFFEEWMRLNKNHPAVKNNLIFAHTQTVSVRDMGEELKEELHGFEPIDPTKNVAGIETRNDND